MGTNQSNPTGRHRQLLKMLGIPLTLLLCGSVYAQPANDDCEDATVVPASAPTPAWSDDVRARRATLDLSDPLLSCNSGDGRQTVWYRYTPDTSGEVSINTFGSYRQDGGELDTAHGVYTGSCGDLVEVACVDQGLNDDLIMEVVAGTTYKIKVGQFANANNAGHYIVNVEEPPPPQQVIIESTRDGMSAPLRDIIASLTPTPPRGVSHRTIEIPNVIFNKPGPLVIPELNGAEEVAAKENALLAEFGLSDLIQVINGQDNNDNAYTLGVLIAPPDTNGDVGTKHYIQMVNLVTEIFDKKGASMAGPFGSNAFWAGLGGNCEADNAGDPHVLYDEETERWLVTQFMVNFQWGLCVAMSTTSDPLGSYYQHEFDFNAIGFPDYPKWGFSTGAINVMANMFAPFQGSGIGAIDKSEVMSAGPATMVFFILGGSQFGFVAADNDGPVFDNTLPTFFTNNGGSGNKIDVWEVYPDWSIPTNSTVAEVAKIRVRPFDTFLCGGFRGACIDQPGSGTGVFPDNVTFLEGITDRLMHRAQTRDFGDRKVAMVSHTIRVNSRGRAGVRWYEFENIEDGGWVLHDQNTFSPDRDHRWMGSIAMTAGGKTCLGYSISSQNTHPSIGVTGRTGDTSFMDVDELVAFDGNIAGNVQTRTARWGDYSMMSVDPTDDSCWYTQEHALPNDFIGEQFGWGTKVIQFTVPDAD